MKSLFLLSAMLILPSFGWADGYQQSQDYKSNDGLTQHSIRLRDMIKKNIEQGPYAYDQTLYFEGRVVSTTGSFKDHNNERPTIKNERTLEDFGNCNVSISYSQALGDDKLSIRVGYSTDVRSRDYVVTVRGRKKDVRIKNEFPHGYINMDMGDSNQCVNGAGYNLGGELVDRKCNMDESSQGFSINIIDADKNSILGGIIPTTTSKKVTTQVKGLTASKIDAVEYSVEIPKSQFGWDSKVISRCENLVRKFRDQKN